MNAEPTPFPFGEVAAGLQMEATRTPVDLDQVAAEYAAQAKRETARQIFEQSCPPNMVESDWSHERLLPYSAAIQRVLAHQPGERGIIASGPTGRGKTRAMWQLMRRLACEEGREVRCYHATDFFSRLQSNVNYGRDDAAGWVEAVARRRILFIDDFGQEAMATARRDWAMSWFFRLLDIRVSEKLPLYITTNLAAKDMTADSRVSGAALRADPMLRRILDVCEPVKFENEFEAAQQLKKAA